MISILVSKIISTESFSVNQIFENKGKAYTYLNPVSYLTALDNKELFSQLDGIFADGGLLVKAIKMVYGKQVTRRSFDMISMDPELFVYVAKHGKTIYIVASKREQVEKAVEIFRDDRWLFVISLSCVQKYNFMLKQQKIPQGVANIW